MAGAIAVPWTKAAPKPRSIGLRVVGGGSHELAVPVHPPKDLRLQIWLLVFFGLKWVGAASLFPVRDSAPGTHSGEQTPQFWDMKQFADNRGLNDWQAADQDSDIDLDDRDKKHGASSIGYIHGLGDDHSVIAIDNAAGTASR